jgi:elongation factor Ts
MSISAALVKQLRDATGAGMMDCKTALTETNGDIEAAIDWLRAEGLIGVATGDAQAVVVEVNSETDFVARNAAFQEIVTGIAGVALGTDGSRDAVGAASYPATGKSVDDTIKDAIATIGENMSLRRAQKLTVSKGAVASYVHNSVADGLGKLGVLVAIETDGDAEKAAAFARQVAMHVAATSPLAVVPEEVDASAVEREKAIFTEQARESGKPDNIIEKMVEGRLRKFYEEVVLLKQAFVINPDLTVEQALKEQEKEIGAPAKITAFVRFALGEGIEKEETDFAAEVAATVKQ